MVVGRGDEKSDRRGRGGAKCVEALSKTRDLGRKLWYVPTQVFCGFLWVFERELRCWRRLGIEAPRANYADAQILVVEIEAVEAEQLAEKVGEGAMGERQRKRESKVCVGLWLLQLLLLFLLLKEPDDEEDDEVRAKNAALGIAQTVELKIFLCDEREWPKLWVFPTEPFDLLCNIITLD